MKLNLIKQALNFKPVKKEILFLIILLGVTLKSTVFNTVDFKAMFHIHQLAYIQMFFGLCTIVLIVYFTFSVKDKRESKLTFNLTDALICLFIVYIGIIFFTTPRFNNLPDQFLFQIILVVIYFLLRRAISLHGKFYIQSFLYIIVFFGVAQSVYAILQFLGVLPNFYAFRIGGSYGNPGDLANVLALSYSITLGLFLNENKRTKKYVLLGLTLLQIAVIVYSKARTAWVACLLTTLLSGAYFNKKHLQQLTQWLKKRKAVMYGVISLVTIVIVVGAYEMYSFKIASANGRLFIWELCLGLISESPFTGHGYSSFNSLLSTAQLNYFKLNPDDLSNAYLAGNSMLAFNDYLQLTVEHGVIALLIYLGVLFRIITLKGNGATQDAKSVLFITKMGLICFMVCMFFSYPKQNFSIAISSIILIALASAYETKNLLKVSFKKPIQMLSIVMLLSFSFGLIAYSGQLFKYGFRWKKAAEGIELKGINTIDEYKKMYDFQKSNPSFIINYGSALLRFNYYEQCIQLFEEYGYLCNTSDMYLLLAEAYDKNKDYAKAEENYLKVSSYIPYLFLPKHKLFKLYLKLNREDDAYNIAQQIKNMKIKIYSETVQNIKTEANLYLASKNIEKP